MKRILIVMVILAALTGSVFAQVPTIGEFQSAFQQFAEGVAGTLASTATSGLNWSPAYIGQFPHFGVGVTAGATMMPYAAIKPVFDMLSVTLPPELSFIEKYGIPLPAAAIDGRIGGFGIPFDIGLKIGLLPEFVKPAGISVDYFIAGADVRFAILKDEGLRPALSVGVGYSYMRGAFGMAVPGVTDQVIDVSAVMSQPEGTYYYTFEGPDVDFSWKSNVIEAKVQLSKNLLFFTPHVGLSAAYGLSSAGGGMTATVTFNNAADQKAVEDALVAAGLPVPTSQGISVFSAANGWAFRIYGGTSISLLIVKLDLSATYNLLTKAYGGSLNFRVQL